ncbi:MAG TPA: exosortase/archaeosortase family protein [Acidimicrobiales bacterium]
MPDETELQEPEQQGSGEQERERTARRGLARVAALIAPAAMTLSGLALLLDGHLVQQDEARLTALIIRSSTSLATSTSTRLVPTITFGTFGHNHTVRLTTACSSAPVLGFMLVGAGALAFGRSRHLGRAVAALMGAVALFFAVNLGRLVMLCLAFSRWGSTGYEVAHLYIGSVLAMAGLIASIGLFLVLSGLWTRERRPRRSANSRTPMEARP